MRGGKEMREYILLRLLIVLTGLFLFLAPSVWAVECASDIDCDGEVGLFDLIAMKSEYGNNPCDACMCDPIYECPSGLLACGSNCVDNSTDEFNCGTCGNTCPYGEICYNGTCYDTGGTGCPPELIDCNARCVDNNTDENNCGVCDNNCQYGEICISGTCYNTGSGCPPYQLDCGGTCFDNSTDENNCGTCGNVCGGGERCDNGTCVDTTYPVFVAKTGQTTSYATGDDGDYQMGVASPSPRFTDNGDGTIMDNLTGLIWLKNASCFGDRDWHTALNDCKTLNTGECGLGDTSAEGDWRLPNVNELQSLGDFSTGTLPNGHPFINPYHTHYSSTTWSSNANYAFAVAVGGRTAILQSKSTPYNVWPVRGGND